MAEENTFDIETFHVDDFLQTRWLEAVFEPDEFADVIGTADEFQALMEQDPDVLFAPPYTRPYEDWCVTDHKAAEQLDPCYLNEQKQVSYDAYQAAWDRSAHPEFCALISDDVETIYALLRISGGRLHPFTAERLKWYLKGRVPWGYKGVFPKGKWIII